LARATSYWNYGDIPMGKIFPSLKNLKAYPQYWNQTLALIEKAFKYQSAFNFKDDFITLMNEENANHLYILTENEKVIAHLGVKIRDINIEDKRIPIAMMGGIAVDENHRGQGLFSYLMNEVKKIHHDDVSAFILWSDLPTMYEKHHFYLCGSQYPLTKKEEKNTYLHLTNPTENEKKQIQNIHKNFFQKHFAYVERTELDWEQLFQSKSSQIWVNERENITSYFVKNKGQDLHNIIHEYATLENRTEFLKQISHWGEVWMTQDYFHEENAHFQFLLSAGKKIDLLVNHLTEKDIVVEHVSGDECQFKFKGTDYIMSCSDFFSGVFGPARFSELKNNKDLFIAGWDSI